VLCRGVRCRFHGLLVAWSAGAGVGRGSLRESAVQKGDTRAEDRAGGVGPPPRGQALVGLSGFARFLVPRPPLLTGVATGRVHTSVAEPGTLSSLVQVELPALGAVLVWIRNKITNRGTETH
jgi:hypothetical protein